MKQGSLNSIILVLACMGSINSHAVDLQLKLTQVLDANQHDTYQLR